MVKEREQRSVVRRGSFTIETACVMPLILLVLMGSLYLNFYVHNRGWLTSAAYEAALTGSMEAVKENGKVYENALVKGKELGNTGFFGAENLTMQVNTGSKVSVIYDLDTVVPFAGLKWHLRAEGTSKVIDPVTRIRKLKATAEIVNMAGGTS